MSDEQESKIEDVFINKLGAKYPMVKVKSSATQDYGIKFYPSIYSIAPDGRVHSVPEDRMPKDDAIVELLKSVSLVPELPEGAHYDPLRVMWDKKQYSKLHSYLDKMLAQDNLEEEVREVLTGQQQELEQRVARKSQRVANLAAGPDYLASREKLEKIQKEWKGFAPASMAKDELTRFRKDGEIQKEIKVSKRYEKLINKYDATKIVQRRKLMEALEKFSKQYEGTYAADQAVKLLNR